MRFVRLIAGILLLTIGLPMLFLGGALWTASQQRSPNGAFGGPLEKVETVGRAIVVPDLDALLRRDAPFLRTSRTGLRIIARTGPDPAFIGLAPSAEVSRYLSGTSHARIDRVSVTRGPLPLRVTPADRTGTDTALGPPGEQSLWIRQGIGVLDLIPDDVRGHRLSLVVMRPDARSGVAVDLRAEVRPGWLDPAAWGLLTSGGILALVGIWLLARPVRPREVIFVVEPEQAPAFAARLGIAALNEIGPLSKRSRRPTEAAVPGASRSTVASPPPLAWPPPPQPSSPQPVSPQPVSPQPVSSQPSSAQPVSPQLSSLQPVSPQLSSLQPVSPQLSSLHPPSSQPASSQPVSPQPVSSRRLWSTRPATLADVLKSSRDDASPSGPADRPGRRPLNPGSSLGGSATDRSARAPAPAPAPSPMPAPPPTPVPAPTPVPPLPHPPAPMPAPPRPAPVPAASARSGPGPATSRPALPPVVPAAPGSTGKASRPPADPGTPSGGPLAPDADLAPAGTGPLPIRPASPSAAPYDLSAARTARTGLNRPKGYAAATRSAGMDAPAGCRTGGVAPDSEDERERRHTEVRRPSPTPTPR